MQNRDARPVDVHAHVRLGDGDVFHCGILFALVGEILVVSLTREHLNLSDFRAAFQPVKVKHDFRIEPHLDQIPGAHVGSVRNYIRILHGARVTVDEQLLGWDALQA